MGVSAQFYNTSSPPNKIDKALTAVGTAITARPNTPCNIITPSLIVDYNSSIAGANYCILGAPFNRKYFVNSVTLDSGNLMIVQLTVDALSTYATAIKSCLGIVTRSAKYDYPTLYIDTQLPIAPNQIIRDGGKLPNSQFVTNATQSYLLTTIGSTNNTP